MKKLLLFIVLCSMSMIGMAQTDVTKFLGIPVDGSKNEMIQKLKLKGFVNNPLAEGVLTGKFNGADVSVHIVTNNNKVCRIMVCEANTTDETNIKISFNNLCEQFKNNSKYINLSLTDQKIKDDENISYEMGIHKKRYEANFFQLPDTATAAIELRSLLTSKYTKEQLANPTEAVTKGVQEITAKYIENKLYKKLVWFKISKYSGEYYITMYYDNEYNMAHGEDL